MVAAEVVELFCSVTVTTVVAPSPTLAGVNDLFTCTCCADAACAHIRKIATAKNRAAMRTERTAFTDTIADARMRAQNFPTITTP